MEAKEYARDAVGHGCIAIDLDGQVQSFTESIRDALIARGELRCQDGTWYLHTRGPLDMLVHAPWLACCDFCSARPVTWDIPCDSFQLGDGHSAGGWVACEACGMLVAAGDRAGLLQRTLTATDLGRQRLPNWRPVIRELHRRFWRHQHGAPTRIPARPFGH